MDDADSLPWKEAEPVRRTLRKMYYAAMYEQYKEDNHMRSKNEKKSIVKSIKLSPLQLQQIEEQADKKGMKFSEYMLDCALHGSNGITPQIAVKMQEMVNMVLEIADGIDSRDYVRKEELRQKANDFDDLFHQMSPQEKYNKLEKQIELFVEGGDAIWESLR